METEDFVDWHGWGRKGSPPTLHIGSLPGRKSLALYVTDIDEIRALAYFRDEESAREAMEVIDRLVFGMSHA